MKWVSFVHRLQVAVIVEGYGEVQSVRILLDRILRELLDGEHITVLRPIRQPRSQLIKKGIIQENKIQNAVRLAVANLVESASMMNDPTLVLILLDADEDCPKSLGPRLLACAKNAVSSEIDVDCALANIEYETWFIAAAHSLSLYFDLNDTAGYPDNPEEERLGKTWVKKRFKEAHYSETQDQPTLTHVMDLAACRAKSSSYDKLCRVLEQRRAI